MGPQKISAALRNEICSTSCQNWDRNASSYIAGRCQPMLIEIKTDQQKRGCETKRATRRRRGDDRKGLTALSKRSRGSPERSGRYGAPHRMSGGAIIINNKC